MSRVAVLQAVSVANVRHNLDALLPWFLSAKDQGVDLLILPENFAYIGVNEHDKLLIAERLDEGEIQYTIAQLAKRFKLWVVAGTLPVLAQHNRVRASCLVFDEAGARVACYDKIHLFDVDVPDGERYQESLTIEPGHTVTVVDTPVGCLGLSVCYDVRFPELYRQLVLKGAQLFAVPSAFTAVTGAAHWEVLLRARAVENLCYVLAANQGGQHENGRLTHGQSMIIDPWGGILGEAACGPGLVVADIDLSYLHTLRQRFPCNNHHKMV